jgi:hypothetical protein
MTERDAEEPFDDTFDDAADDDVDIEAPEADRLDQHTAARPDRAAAARREAPFEADDADAADQERDADFGDEEEYR